MLSQLLIKLAADQVNARRRDDNRPDPPGPVYSAPWHPRPSAADPEKCIRAAVYQGLDIEPQPFPGRAGLVFDDGEWHEELTQDWLRGSAYQIHSIQIPLTVAKLDWIEPGLWRWCEICRAWVRAEDFHGHADWIMTDPLGRDILTEHKSSSRFGWHKWLEGALPLGHIAQTGCYLVGAHKLNPDLTRAVLLIKCKDTAQYLDFVLELVGNDLHLIEAEVSMDQAPIDLIRDETTRWQFAKGGRVWSNFLTDILDRFRLIQGYLDRRTLPRRMYALGEDWQCDYCRWGKVCWKDYEQEVKAAGSIKVPGLATLLEERERLAPMTKRREEVWTEAKRLAVTSAAEMIIDGDWKLYRVETKAGHLWRARKERHETANHQS